VIVADTNLVVYLPISGQFTQAAETIRAGDHHWIVPSLFRFELMNVLTHYIRLGKLERDEGLRLFRRGTSLVTVSDFEPNVTEVFNLSVNSGCSSYDVEFVALAMHLGVRLVTADQQLLRAFPNTATDMTLGNRV
jgi:predicted nucleic acid-binding protein